MNWCELYRFPANRLDVALIAGRYCAWEVRGGNGVSMIEFNTLSDLISYSRLFAGMVLPSLDLESPIRAAGLLCTERWR